MQALIAASRLAEAQSNDVDLLNYANDTLDLAERCTFRVEASEAHLLIGRHALRNENRSFALEHFRHAEKLVQFTATLLDWVRNR